MKNKQIIKSSIASLLLGSMVSTFVIPGITTFAKRIPSNSQYEKSDREKNLKNQYT